MKRRCGFYCRMRNYESTARASIFFKAFRRYLCDGGPMQKAIKEAVGKAEKESPAKPRQKTGLKRADLSVGSMSCRRRR